MPRDERQRILDQARDPNLDPITRATIVGRLGLAGGIGGVVDGVAENFTNPGVPVLDPVVLGGQLAAAGARGAIEQGAKGLGPDATSAAEKATNRVVTEMANAEAVWRREEKTARLVDMYTRGEMTADELRDRISPMGQAPMPDEEKPPEVDRAKALAMDYMRKKGAI